MKFNKKMEVLKMTNIKIYYLLNMEDLKNIANELDFKVKTKTIDLN